MIMAQQVQCAVNQQACGHLIKGAMALPRLVGRAFDADHHIAQQRASTPDVCPFQQ
jgi:hypothetical protein